LTLITLVLLDERRLVIGAFAIQSVFVGLLFTRVLAAQLAGIKMLVGLLAALVLYTTAHQCALLDLAAGEQVGAGGWRDTGVLRRLPFRVFAAILAMVLGAQLYGRMAPAVPGIEAPVLQAAALLVCIGLLSVGLTSEPLKTGCGLLSILQGFGIFYAAVEPALAVIWMMAAVDLAVAVAVSYLARIQPPPEPDGSLA
jgi:hypothetical protein